MIFNDLDKDHTMNMDILFNCLMYYAEAEGDEFHKDININAFIEYNILNPRRVAPNGADKNSNLFHYE